MVPGPSDAVIAHERPEARQPEVTTRYWLLAGTVALAFGVAYAPVFRTLAGQWGTNDTYSFGVLVPFISAYLIWTRRERLRAVPVVPSLAPGLTVVALAAGLLLVGRLGAVVAFQELSLIVMLFGLTLLLLGWAMLRELWFPLAYMLLMLPIWEPVTDRLHYRSQLFSAALAETLMRWSGVPVLRHGVYLDLANVRLEVASACSGVNFLIAVVATGVPQAYLFLRGWGPRAAVILFAVAVAFLSNGLRVAIIGVLAYREVSAALHGPGHVLQGLFVSGIGFAAVMAGVAVLARRYPRRQDASGRHGVPTAPPAPDFPRLRTASAFAVACLVGVVVFQPRIGATAVQSVAAGPPVLGSGWSVLPTPVAAQFVKEGGSPNVEYVYEDPSGHRVQLYLAPLIYAGRTASVEYREVALPTNVSATDAPVDDRSPALSLNQATFHTGARETHVLYGFDVGGTMTTQSAVAKMYAVSQLLSGGQTFPRLFIVSYDRSTTPPEVVGRFVRVLGEQLAMDAPGTAR